MDIKTVETNRCSIFIYIIFYVRCYKLKPSWSNITDVMANNADSCVCELYLWSSLFISQITQL